VYHLAAMSNTQQAVNDPWLCTQLNCVGTVNVLDGCKNAAVERVVIAGSTLLSGLQVQRQMSPQDEDVKNPGLISEASPIEVIKSEHPYVTSKLFEEMIARDYMHQYGLPVTILRYGIQYGPRMTPGVVVHSFIERALAGRELTVHGDGKQWRQYVHVKDVAEAHLAVIDRWDESEGGTYNLVSDRVVTILDIAKVIQDLVPGIEIVHGPERAGDITVKAVSGTAAREDLLWTPKIGLEDGIKSTMDWYKNHRGSGMPRK
jgi:UDP-glucose 4-epimerase